MGDKNPSSDSHSHIIRRSDYMLFFADDISLSDTTLTGLVFVLLYLVLYISLIFWAKLKDRQKEIYTDKVLNSTQTQNYTQGGSPAKSPMGRRARLRAINIDITHETLDFTTNNSIRGSDHPQDMSAIFQYTSPDSKDLNVTSPMNKLDLSTPIAGNDKVIKFNHMRTPTRQVSGQFEANKFNASALTNEENSAARTDGMESRDDAPPTSKDDGGVGKRVPTEEFTIPIPDKQPAKQKAKAKIRDIGNIAPVVQTRQTTRTKFSKLLSQRHVFLSTVKRMSKISPRYKRVTLLYFLLSCDFFGMSFTFIDLSIFESKILPFIKVSLGTWVIFMLISWLSSVSKEGLKKAKTTEEFQNEIVAIEKEAKYKDIAVHLIVGLFTISAVAQYALFVSLKSNYFLSWCLCSFGVFAIQMLIYDALYLLIVAAIYVRAYESREMRKIYRQLNGLRFWKI